MTFYEAALDVLRREGKPLHYEDITQRAMADGLLSHVGRVPHEIMRSRLLAMARRDEGRHLAVVAPGVFGLVSWGLSQDPEAVAQSGPVTPKTEASLRPRERTPMTLGELRTVREAERSGKFDNEDKEARARGRRRRRRPRKDESSADALAAIVAELGGGPIDLQYVVDAVPRQPSLPAEFPLDLDGLRALAGEENQRLEALGGGPRFVLDGDRVAVTREVASPEPAQVVAEPKVLRQEGAFEGAAEKLLQVLRRLPADRLEHVLLDLAGRHSLADAKVAKRSAKGSPLFTGMVKLGVTQVRVAVRMLLSGRDVREDDVDELRADLENYNAALGVVLSLGRVARAARGRAEDMNKKPVLLLDGESLSLSCARAGVGTRVRLEEIVDVVPGLLEA